MKIVNSYSIKTKLNLIIILVTSISLLVASSIFTYYDREEYKKVMHKELSILGNIIGDRSTAALLFDDQRVVEQTLASVKVKTTIITALVYNDKGLAFAQYSRDNKDNRLPGPLTSELNQFKGNLLGSDLKGSNAQGSNIPDSNLQSLKNYSFSSQFLEVWEPIMQNSEIIGLVYLKSDLTELDSRLSYFIKTVLIIFILSLCLAFLLALRLQKIISKPIYDLVTTTSQITQKEDYSIRASEHGEDELGLLIKHFNKMLDQIQNRDKALQDINLYLEQRVDERTLELTQSNEDLIKAKNQADEASRAKSEFLANMSHEIRTPMNGVLTTAELMLSEELSPKAQSYLSIINTSAFSLLGIINDILDFSKIEVGKLSIENNSFYLSHLFDRISDVFVTKFEQKKLELLFDIDPFTPDHLMGDVMRLQQIFTNLIGNALKFTPENGVIICGTDVIEATPDKVKVSFFVKDNGMGIEANKLDSLFDAFTQADSTTTRKYGGTGLGLSICKHLVELMDGSIWAESIPGKGCSFYFSINFNLSSNKHKPIFSLPEKTKAITILVVDDQEISLAIAENMVQSFGFKSITASCGQQAIDILKSDHLNTINLVLIDLVMPELDGLETAWIIRKELAITLPIILMSAFEKGDKLRTFSRLSINAFLQKPLRQSVLFDTIIHLHSDEYQSNHQKQGNSNTKTLVYGKHLHGNSLLVAEDNLTNQQVILAVFDQFDVYIRLVNNGQEALDAVQNNSFDAILMDMQMPVMDGYEATRKIRTIPAYKSVPIIALTAHAMAGDEDKCILAGSNAYVTKPINQEYLFQVLARFLRSKDILSIEGNSPEQNNSPEQDNGHDQDNSDAELFDIIPGINIYEACKQLNIDKVKFKKILAQFLSQNKATIKRMSQLLVANQWQELQTFAHDLKGSGANIGAYDLQNKAYQLELACNNKGGKEKGDKEQIQINFNEFLPALQQVLNSIKRYVVSDSKKFINQNAKPIFNVEKDILNKSITNLLIALEQTKPTEIRDLLSLLKEQIKHHEINKLESQIDNFDFDDAIETLEAIRSSL